MCAPAYFFFVCKLQTKSVAPPRLLAWPDDTVYCLGMMYGATSEPPPIKAFRLWRVVDNSNSSLTEIELHELNNKSFCVNQCHDRKIPKCPFTELADVTSGHSGLVLDSSWFMHKTTPHPSSSLSTTRRLCVKMQRKDADVISDRKHAACPLTLRWTATGSNLQQHWSHSIGFFSAQQRSS